MEKEINIICNDSTSFCSVRRSFAQQFGFTQPCNGVANTVFEDLSNRSVDILITVNNNTTLPCVMTVIIELMNGERIERIVPAAVQVPNQGFFSGFVGFEFKSVKRIQIRCEGNPLSICNGFISIEKFICACCTDNKENKCKCGKEHNDCGCEKKHKYDYDCDCDCDCGKKDRHDHNDCDCKKDRKPPNKMYKFDKHKDKKNDHDYCTCHEHSQW